MSEITNKTQQKNKQNKHYITQTYLQLQGKSPMSLKRQLLEKIIYTKQEYIKKIDSSKVRSLKT